MSHITKITELVTKLHDAGITAPECHQRVVEEAIARATLSYLVLTNNSQGTSHHITERDDVMDVLNQWHEIAPFNLELVCERIKLLQTTHLNKAINGWCEGPGVEVKLNCIEGIDDYSPCTCPHFKSLFVALNNEMIKYCK